MNVNRTGSRKGFSLVELLAVVMILAVLAAIAVPMYINSRKTAAARTCLANETAIAAAESAWATRNGSYNYDVPGPPQSIATQTPYVAGITGTPAHGGLVGAPEGLSQVVTCPLARYSYTNSYRVYDGGTGNCVIYCWNAAEHATVLGNVGDYTKTLAAPVKDAILP